MELHTSVQGVGVATAQPLIAAPGAGLRIVVLGLVISVAAAVNVSLIDSVTAANTKQWQLGINGHAEPSPLRWELSNGAALKYTTSAAGPTSIEVDYIIEATGGTGN
jgi:hypothetical protein